MRLIPLAIAAAVGKAALSRLTGGRGYSFRGRTVVISGARGLALEMARIFAREGARLALLAREGDELNRAAHELSRMGAPVITVKCDVREQEHVGRAVAAIVERYGVIDVLVNNAGVIQGSPLANLELSDFENAMRTHFWGPLYLTQAVLPNMRQRGAGRIVNISSIGGLVAVPHLAAYCASKFALTGLSDAMRAELRQEGILVTTVCPGLMRTGSHVNAQFKGQHRKEFTWFSVMNALPLFSMNAERAAGQIVEACRSGRPHLTITTQARIIAIADAVFPSLTGQLMALTNRFLPQPVPEGDALYTGWESQSPLSPSLLTTLADRAIARNNEAETEEQLRSLGE